MTARTRALAAVVGVVVLVLLAVVLGRADLLGASSGPAPSPRASAAGSPSPSRDPDSGLAYVDLGRLPAEAQLTVRRIDAGGPFPYSRDGVVFENRQHLLPRQSAGYYREYTVPTPGSADRGARRIVAGAQGRQLFYSADHYVTFARIRR